MRWLRSRGTAAVLRDFALIRVVIWTVAIPIAVWLRWAESVVFVTIISLIALVLSDLAVWQAARSEVATVEAE